MIQEVRIALHAPATEAAAWADAAKLVEQRLGGAVRFVLETCDTASAAAASGAPILGFSLQDGLEDAEPFAAFAAAWHERAARLASGPLARGDLAFVTTILRHLPPGRQTAMARLRRLNLLAAQLSQAHGLLVIDLDRALAHRGALALRTDASLGGQAGQQAAAQVIAGPLLTEAMMRFVDDATLDQAIAAHAAEHGAAIDRLTVPIELIPRQTTRVGRREQVSYSIRRQFDDRSWRGLLRDVRSGRMGPAAFARAIARRIAERWPLIGRAGRSG